MPPDFQARVAEFTKAHQLEHNAASRMLDLVSETGETAKEMLKATNFGSTEFSSTDAWRQELGDVFFALACLANVTKVNLADSLEAVLEKYRARIALHSTPASSG